MKLEIWILPLYGGVSLVSSIFLAVCNIKNAMTFTYMKLIVEQSL